MTEGLLPVNTTSPLYVDDVEIIGSDRTTINELESSLTKRLEMLDLGLICYCLSIEVIRDPQQDADRAVLERRTASQLIPPWSTANALPRKKITPDEIGILMMYLISGRKENLPLPAKSRRSPNYLRGRRPPIAHPMHAECRQTGSHGTSRSSTNCSSSIRTSADLHTTPGRFLPANRRRHWL